MSIFLSVLSFSFIIFIHELGHFLFAKLFKVKVEVFSVGIGPSLFKIKIKDTEYRFSPIFLGGYCKLKGAEHLENELRLNRQLEADKDSIFGISNFKKILIYFAGPLFNLIFALVIFIVIEMLGIVYPDYSSKIVVISNSALSKFRNGDVILNINDSDIRYFSDLKRVVPLEDSRITFTVLRDGKSISFKEHTNLDKLLKEISPWVDLVIAKVQTNSSAEVAGLKPNDRIISINDIVVNNNEELGNLIARLNVNLVNIKYERDGEILTSKLVFQDINKSLGVYLLPGLNRVVKADNLGIAIRNSFNRVLGILGNILYSIVALFIDFSSGAKNFTGPIGVVNILVGSFSFGILYWLDTIAIFNLLIAGMNLFFVVIPMLDGGQILITLIEILRGKRFRAKFVYYFYIVGILLMLILFILGFLNDFHNLG
ncbi:RIP metalloprotease RseP [Borrelia anserina]|uniref:Zinc metalloprotease n=2 Tax=Borrelia anserina TaxID=143 RepID=W5SQK0_BORAN|nr:RIP metalloprotease RseP [Borrelia anserina]AHH08080.1 Membrane endopeptidase, M50 family protein [Borrelia anserina BA2]AHH08913.1 Membrane endopeptidase, M50 family protein [Borrelia anserina BA2]APR64626.1 RIP metalloprotease RseP [Borrelia anserina Es]UPA06540.1 RIP metalloprotease RseP [Borrelia anserina]